MPAPEVSIVCLGSDMSFTVHARLFTRIALVGPGVLFWVPHLDFGHLVSRTLRHFMMLGPVYCVMLLSNQSCLHALSLRGANSLRALDTSSEKQFQDNPANSGFAGRISRIWNYQESWKWVRTKKGGLCLGQYIPSEWISRALVTSP